ncbi:MAG: YdcF family protein, partial [Actinomycetota bacterium]|nr:YdcF family protein [Actinomycetota bacterium]
HYADAIVVLGAAQYNGKPSPVFEARLNHAAYLFRQQMSSQIVVTGGKKPGDNFTEAEAGARYLQSRGIKSDAISQVGGKTTLESLRALGDVAADKQIDTLLLVSDPLHSERLKLIAHDLGFTNAWASPDSYLELHRSRVTKLKELAHEVGSVIAYELWERWR